MPVLGHTFVGLATAKSIRPRSRSTLAVAVWTPVVIGLAYLPDLVGYFSALAGLGPARLLAHSLIFALGVSILLAPLLAGGFGLSLGRAFLLTLFTILLHDGLDNLQASDQALLWPFSDRPVALRWTVIPSDIRAEALLFVLLFGLFTAIRLMVSWYRRGAVSSIGHSPPGDALPLLGGYAVSGLIVLVALGTHYLRGQRQAQLERAEKLIMRHKYDDALAWIDRADQFPSPARPGKLDYLRAVAYEGLGDRQRAERYFLVSYLADPWYFWNLADLAVFYASGSEPTEQRLSRAAPYIARLKADFGEHPGLPGQLERIQRKLDQNR